MNKKSFLLVIVVGLFLLVTYEAYAITTRNLKTAVQSIRYRVPVADVRAATAVHPSGQRRELTLFSLPGGDQILSMVTNVKTAFVLPSGARVLIHSIRPKRGGVELSPCDVTYTADLSFVNFEHKVGSCGEFAFYDEDLATDIAVTFVSEDGSDLAGLTAGSVDFIVAKIQ